MPGSIDPEVRSVLGRLVGRPRVTARVKEKHPFHARLVLVVDGHDRTLGSKIANQVFVSKN